MPEIKPKEVYTTKEARKFLKVSQSTMKRMIKKGVISAYKVGGVYRILGSEILKLISPKVETKVYRKFYKPIKDEIKKTVEKW